MNLFKNKKENKPTEYETRIGYDYEAYSPMVFRRCHFLLKNEAAARDATQDIFLSLLKKENMEIKHPASFYFRLATNRCLNIIRDNKKYVLDDKLLYSIAASENIEQQIETSDLLENIFLGEKHAMREIAVMKYIDKMTYDEIASLTGFSSSWIRKLLLKLQKKAVKIAKENIKGGANV